MADKIIDLHLHSNNSDGKLTPQQIVEKLTKKGVFFAVLTDHDSVSGVMEFAKETKKAGIGSISGVEMSTEQEGIGIHILGYGIDIKNKRLLGLFKKQTLERRKTFEKYIAHFEKAGFTIDKSKSTRFKNNKYQEFRKIKTLTKVHIFELIWDVPENRKLCIQKYGLKNSEYIRRDFIDNFMTFPGQLAYVDKKSISAKDSIDLIHQAGGIAVWAHPGLEIEFKNEQTFNNIFNSLLSCGIDGLEAFSTAHSHTQTRMQYLCGLAKKYKLVATIGTDDHDGSRIGKLKISSKYHEEALKNLLSKLDIKPRS